MRPVGWTLITCQHGIYSIKIGGKNNNKTKKSRVGRKQINRAYIILATATISQLHAFLKLCKLNGLGLNLRERKTAALSFRIGAIRPCRLLPFYLNCTNTMIKFNCCISLTGYHTLRISYQSMHTLHTK